jgi:hypothetical protein
LRELVVCHSHENCFHCTDVSVKLHHCRYIWPCPLVSQQNGFAVAGELSQVVPGWNWNQGKKAVLKSLVVALSVVLLSSFQAAAQKVTLPLTLDYALLTSLLVQSSFTGEDNSAAVVGSAGDCLQVELSEPQYSSAGDLLRLEMGLFIRFGTQLGDSCLLPVEWYGYLELMQRPQFDGRAFGLSFQTIDSSLLTRSRQPASVAGLLWEFAKPLVSAHLDSIRFNLAPPVQDLQDFLTPLFAKDARQAAETVLESLHGGQVRVGEEGLTVELLAEVEEVFEPEQFEVRRILTPAERQQLTELWETWDAFLVRLMVTIAGRPLSPQDQQLLGDVLLDARHVFIAALEEDEAGEDIVRSQFVQAWRQLAPVFRRQLYGQPSENSLGYLAFFTAADALALFDRMGPAFGIEISRQGLLRLAEMLTGGTTSLPYGLEIDPQLRNLLQMPPIDDQVSPMEDIKELDLEVKESGDEPLTLFFDFLVRPAYGGELPDFGEILQWRVPEKETTEYLKAVRNVLDDASGKVVSRNEFPAFFRLMFKTLTPAIAWQESCFRQFVVKGNKLTYLLSYNQSSVGLMQINERVWRGIYDRGRLRWDIRYNALAGCEIIELYLRRYALNKKSWPKDGDSRLLARTIYAMYNGGPGQYEKFLARERAGNHYRSDLLFLEKLQWSEKRQWRRVDECLVGG